MVGVGFGVSIVAAENRREIVVRGVSGENGSTAYFAESASSGAQRQASFRGAGISSAVGAVERVCVPLQ